MSETRQKELREAISASMKKTALLIRQITLAENSYRNRLRGQR